MFDIMTENAFTKIAVKNDTPVLPITSYGLILFCMDNSGASAAIAVTDGTSAIAPKFLIYQRRDNYEYIDILRGNWNNEKRLKELFEALSPAEKQRIRDYTFEELWNDLWVTKENKMYKDGFEKAKKRYEMIKPKISSFLQCGPQFSTIEPPWGFPKGKKNGSEEKGKDCALREFAEETGFPTDDIVIWETDHFSEYYKGNNGKPYCTHYYVAEAASLFEVKRISTPNCIRQDAVSDEAEDARWATYEEACLKLGARRQGILKKVLLLIKTSYDKYTLL